MIQNARALDPDVVPREIVGRHQELCRLTTALRPAVDGHRPETTFLFGASGTGKTCVAKRCLQKLEEESLDVATHYLHCWSHSRYGILQQLAQQIGLVDTYRSMAADELLAKLRTLDQQHVVVLDEVDALAEKAVLHDIYELSNVGMVAIANREAALFAELDERINSRLTSGVTIQFHPYATADLVDILDARVQWGLHDDAIRHAQLQRIARAADGDARKAIGILRAAARDAADSDLTQITDTVLAEAIPTAETALRDERLAKLGDDHRLIYDLIADAGELPCADLYERYREQTDDPVSDRQVRTYLKKLVDYDLVERVGPKQDRRFRVIG